MGFFTMGNIITILIVLLILFLYRQLDRGSRNLKLLRDYTEKLKKDLSAFVEEQESAVKDYTVSLNVERDSARELMKHLQLTDEELNKKAQSLARIDTQLKTYEGSLAELDKMTGRVQENMIRVREESAFVEAASKKINSAKARLDEIETELDSVTNRFEKENFEALTRTGEDVINSVKGKIQDLSSAVDHMEDLIEEQNRRMSGDMEEFNKILTNAVEEAGRKADKMEEAALKNLRDQAEERIRRIKTQEEERLRVYQENAKARIAEVQNLIKNIKEEWRTDRAEWETKDKERQEEYRNEVKELNSLFIATENQINLSLSSLENRMTQIIPKADELIKSQEETLRLAKENADTEIQKASEEMKQSALEITGKKLEEYRNAQDLEYKRLESLADDSRLLDQELRKNMQEIVKDVREEFLVFKKETQDAQKTETEKFSSLSSSLKEDIAGLESELESLKSTAKASVSNALKIFEEDFITDLTKRSSDIDKRIFDWQENLDERLNTLSREAEDSRTLLESSITGELRSLLSAQNERLVSQLEHLKKEVEVFEEGIREEMNAADDSVTSFREQLSVGINEAKKEAELTIKSELGRHAVASSESIKQYQRDLDTERNELSQKVRELDQTIESARLKVNEFIADTDNRVLTVRSSVESTEQQIKDAMNQTGRVEEIRRDMERKTEDLKTEMDRLDQRRVEAAQLENEFIKIRRLEDDVNAKMTRFLSEKRRIEAMETDFQRLLQISREVEEKLKQVTSSDDILQGVQLQIRKLEDSLVTAEDKFQRIERKNQILENTNEGIDRNFRLLQDSEKLSVKIEENIGRYTEDLGTIKTSIETLSKESEKAREASDKIDILDDALDQIEERIKSMQRARQWIADAETRLEDLNRQAQTQARAIDSLVNNKKSGAKIDLGEGAPTPQKKENVITLAKQGWKVEEIAKTMKISRGEVELILDMAPRD